VLEKPYLLEEVHNNLLILDTFLLLNQ